MFLYISLAVGFYAKAQTSDDAQNRSWQICNETSFILDFAIASIFDGKNAGKLSVKKWQKLRAGTCLTANLQKATPRYVYARSSPLHQGGIREWKGRHVFCVSPHRVKLKNVPDFIIQDDKECLEQNRVPAKFLRVIPTEERTVFTEPNGYGKKAQTAGLQRLLLDNNYDIKRIDGIGGRRTSNTLRKFLKDKGLNNGLSTEAKLDALESSVLAAKNKTGVEFCNQSSAKIWTALAWRESNYWLAKGWWPIKPKSCIRPFTKSLKGLKVYYYARLETDTSNDLVIKTVSTSQKNKNDEKSFCIGPSSFASVAHEYCQDRGYVSARFLPLPNNLTGTRIDLAEKDFAPETLKGLR
ncbi:MAG: DUF1036 domain-containing protein [Robiginitomaculum sp.]|nr:DUF1036 domain-containing protein [Robiginitomaculum sp.]